MSLNLKITLKEILSLLLAIIILSFSNSFFRQGIFLKSLLFFFIILTVFITAKKLVAYYLESETEEKIWAFQRYWFMEGSYFKNPIPIGVILPFLLSIVSLGSLKWFAVTETEIKPTKARTAKRHGFYSYSEMTEWHIACISAAGIFSLIVLSFISYLINYPELTKLAVYFSAYNLLPIGKLDGTKIFFGSRILYFTLLTIVLIALAYAVFLV